MPADADAPLPTATDPRSEPARAGNRGAAFRERPATYDERDHARLRLAAAMRDVIAELLSTTADTPALQEVTELVEQAARLLASRPHGRPYEGHAEGSLVGPTGFVDHSPFMGPMSPLAPPIVVEVLDDRIIGTVTYGPPYEGPPGCVHGGFIAAGFDDVLGLAQSLSGMPGMTGRLEVSYRSPTPLLQELRYEGWVTSIEGRKILTAATLMAGDRLCAEATGLFISMRPEVFGRLLSSRIGTPGSTGTADLRAAAGEG
jgi:acyl-coenzyme A thioesterase PaaI-like protein